MKNGLPVEPAPRLVNFGNVGVSTSKTQRLILHNRTKSTVSGAAAPMAGVFSLSPPGPFTIAPHGITRFQVQFAPAATGRQSTDAMFTLSEPNEPELSVPVIGNGVPGRLTLSRRVVNFGKLRSQSQIPANRSLNLRNSGRGVLTGQISQMTVPFSVNPSGNYSLQPGQHETLTISFYPNKSGQVSENLNISSSDPRRSQASVSVVANALFTPSTTPTPTLTLATPTPTATATNSFATPTATITTLPSPLAQSTSSKSSGAVLFAGHSMGGAMLGAPLSRFAESAGPVAQVYIPESDAFRDAGRMHSQRVGATGTTLPNGKVLIAGGGACKQNQDGTRLCTASDTADLYDPGKRKFAAAGSGSGGKMSSARMGHTATLISGCGCALDGDVLIAGGNPGAESVGDKGAGSSAAPLASAELYDYRTDSFIAIPAAMESAREGAVAALLPGAHGKILIAGGDSKGFFQNSIGSAEIFDPTAESFAPTGAMNSARELASAVVLDPAVVSGSNAGDVLVAGGIAAAGNLAGGSLDSAELYDPVSGSWSTVGGSMAVPRALHSMTLFTGGPAAGQVLIAGGVAFDAHGRLALMTRNTHAGAELFDPASGTFSKTGSMKSPRAAHGAALLGSGPHEGGVLVAGGQRCTGGCGASHPAAELYDPATGSWTASRATMNPPIGAVLGGVVPVP